MSLVPEKITPPTLSRRSRSQLLTRRKTGGTKEANRVEAVLKKALRHVELGHRRPECGILALCLGPRITIDHEPAGFQPDGHVDDPIRDRLELADRLAELLAGSRSLDAARRAVAASCPATAGQDRAPLPFQSRR